jgi:hypothetical protein
MKEDFLSEKMRAEDIILGSLGIGEEAKLISVKSTKSGYKGIAAWADGEEFPFENEDEIDELQLWALKILSVK